MGVTSVVHEFSVLYSRHIDPSHKRKQWDDGFLRVYETNNIWEVVNAQGRRVMATKDVPENTGLVQLHQEGFQLVLEQRLLLEIVDGEDRVTSRPIMESIPGVKIERKEIFDNHSVIEGKTNGGVKQEVLDRIQRDSYRTHIGVKDEKTNHPPTILISSNFHNLELTCEKQKPTAEVETRRRADRSNVSNVGHCAKSYAKTPIAATRMISSQSYCYTRIPQKLSRTFRYLPKRTALNHTDGSYPLLSVLLTSLDDEIIEDSESEYENGTLN